MVTSLWSIWAFPVLLQGPIALGVEAIPHCNPDSLSTPFCLLLLLDPYSPHVRQLLQKSTAEVFPLTCFSSQPLPTNYNTAANQTLLGFQEFTQLLPKPTSRHISVPQKQIKLHYFCLHIFPAFPLLPICLLSSIPLSFPKLNFKPFSWLDSIHHWNSFLLPHP